MTRRRSPRLSPALSIPSFISVYLLLLASLNIVMLTWVYLRTQEVAALAYLFYVVFDWVVIPRLTSKKVLEAIAANSTATWFGATADQRKTRFLSLIRALRGTEAVFFAWLLLSLVNL